ncbi:hypothetical protein DL768_001118 [Monosporascus sp. mg162]|nr:hypothetical protein DL768_001118 [Monosporascus sp. mg162]
MQVFLGKQPDTPGSSGAVRSVVVEAGRGGMSSSGNGRSGFLRNGVPGTRAAHTSSGGRTRLHVGGCGKTSGARRLPPPVRGGLPKSGSQTEMTSAESDITCGDSEISELMKQPVTCPIPLEQLVEEVKGIYAGLVMARNIHSTRFTPIDAAFLKAHGILFSGFLADKFDFAIEKFDSTMEEFVSRLDSHINDMAEGWREAGYYISISICCALLSYGKENNKIQNAINNPNSDRSPDETTEMVLDEKLFSAAARLAQRTYMVVFHRINDANVLAFVHTTMVFVFRMTNFPNAIALIGNVIPWEPLCVLLNSLLQSSPEYDPIHDEEFPRQAKEEALRPLPEDFAMKGLLWVDDYFPIDWFSNNQLEEDEKYFETKWTTGERRERILWLGRRIAKYGRWLSYDPELHRFQTAAKDQGRT